MLKRSRLVVLLSLVVFTSGWVRLPVPASWLIKEVELDGLRVKVTADTAKFSWALGRVEVDGVRLRLDGQEVLLAPKAKVHLGLLPFTAEFGKPWLVELQGPQIELDEELLRRLPTPEDSGAQEVPELAFSVTGGRLAWRTVGDAVLAWEVEQLRGKLSHLRSDVQLAGRMLEPVQSAVRAKASAERDAWWFQLEGENSRAEDAWRPQDIEVLRGIEVRPGQYSFRLAAHQTPGQPLQSELQLSLQNASAEIAEPPLHLPQIQLQASVTPEQAKFVIRDDGPGFDPAQMANVATPEQLVQISGRGRVLMWSIMDEVRYNAAGNELTLIKRAPEMVQHHED